jgi:hypothetical protein
MRISDGRIAEKFPLFNPQSEIRIPQSSPTPPDQVKKKDGLRPN